MAHHAGPDDSWHGKIQPNGSFPPEAGRYHLYIGLFCPYAHRVNLVRYLKGLTDIIDISIVKPYPKGDDKGWPGWQFPADDNEYPGATADKIFGSKYLHEVYFKADKDYKGRFSVPVLWDKKTNTIVNNVRILQIFPSLEQSLIRANQESAELLRSLPRSFNETLPPAYAEVDLYPSELRAQIDSISEWMQNDLNTGVYKAGFAPNQEVYDQKVIPVFGALNKVEKIVSEHGGPYVLGERLTELDIRLYATLIRFDTVYVQHFKCNLGTIRHDYPVLNNWLKNLYWNVAGFKASTNFKHIKENYTKSHLDINPKSITPMGPYPDIEEGFESDFSKIKPGGIKMPAVLEYEAKLP